MAADASLEVAVAACVENIERLRKRLGAVEGVLEQLPGAQAEALKAEAAVRAAADGVQQALVRTAQTSGLSLTLVGVVWLVFGVFCSAFPAEIARGRW